MENNDEYYISKYIKGDQESLRILIDKYTSSIYNFSARFIGKDNAEDLTQDVFIKVWKNIKKFDVKKAHFKTWIFSIARNAVIDFLRKKKMIVFSDLDNEGDVFSDNLEDEAILPDEAMIKIEDESLLNNALDELSANYKEILILYYQEDMTFKEIGYLINKPLNTVKSYHRRALIQLKTILHQN